ncbi:hypothetical protein NC653_022167 [Populus alba x Populus x berolinensis]|uniref:Uncharacterized protein n=1 Tax=Populus alba x Populus x berolinensis TaxID=444605 RepID=A0AAD6VU83_9ROSI|nr:hypothetical protein NC653_022167 [Populus alba x Populus x berolinensis]
MLFGFSLSLFIPFPSMGIHKYIIHQNK